MGVPPPILENRKIGFPHAGDGFLPSCLSDRDCVVLAKNKKKGGVLFGLFACYIFSKIKTQNFLDDALLV